MAVPTAVHPAALPLLERVSDLAAPVPVGCVSLLSTWLSEAPEDPTEWPAPLADLLPLHAVAYHRWHERGVDGTGPGLLALHR